MITLTPPPWAQTVLRNDEDGKTPTIFGYGAVYYDGTPETEYELYEDVVERVDRDAFDEVLGNSQLDVIATFNHDMNNVIGRRSANTLKIGSDKRGMWYEIDPPDTTVGRELVSLIRRGDVKGSSFMGLIQGEEWVYAKDGMPETRTITNVLLKELGPVTMPAYDATTADTRCALRSSGHIEGAMRGRKRWWQTELSRLNRRVEALVAKGTFRG